MSRDCDHQKQIRDISEELRLAKTELAYQNEEKENRAAELTIANTELVRQNEEKEKRAAELAVANTELAHQNEEKEKRAAELAVANTELAYQNEEKEKRAAELAIANTELVHQNEEKEKRAAELAVANKELIDQNIEKEKRASELAVANKELNMQNKRVLYLSYHDYMSGLYNRAYFEEEKKRLDTSGQLPVSIIMGDINGLRLINDGFGYRSGDEVIIAIAKILRSCCRKGDIVARIGGDEFGILLPQTSSQSAQRTCRRIADACQTYSLAGHLIYPSISVGYATKNTQTETLDGVSLLAEESMTKQKLLDSRSAHNSILASIKAIMFEKSQETEEHAGRLVALTKSLGVAMSLTNDQFAELELLSTLHDIGKMSISASILSKRGSLSDVEWIEIRKHPEVGFRIAQSSPELLPIAKCILYHHERWDGKGYPQGLVEKEIPLLARILAIVDAFDAMTNDRAYRAAMTKEEALAEISINSGTQFDPEISQLFIRIMTSPDAVS